MALMGHCRWRNCWPIMSDIQQEFCSLNVPMRCKLKIAKFLSIALLATAGVSNVSAETITFESGLRNGFQVPNGYQAMNWTNFYTFDTTSNPSSSGYKNGTVSGKYVAYNGFASTATLSSPVTFSLNSAFFTAAWRDGLTVKVVGKGEHDYVTEFLVDTQTPTNHIFNWTGLKSVSFSSFGGTAHAGYAGNSTHFVMDNLTINNVPAVPEPETYALFLAGLGLMTTIARRRKAAWNSALLLKEHRSSERPIALRWAADSLPRRIVMKIILRHFFWRYGLMPTRRLAHIQITVVANTFPIHKDEVKLQIAKNINNSWSKYKQKFAPTWLVYFSTQDTYHLSEAFCKKSDVTQSASKERNHKDKN